MRAQVGEWKNGGERIVVNESVRTRLERAVTEADLAAYRRDGYHLARGLFSAAEVEKLRDHYMRLREAGSYPGDFGGVDPTSEDPLKRFPRMIHMHRWDETSLQWMIDA